MLICGTGSLAMAASQLSTRKRRQGRVSRVAHVGRSRGLGFAGGRGCPEAYDIRVIGVLPPRDAGAIRLHGLGAAGLSADERRAGAKGFFNFQGKSDLAVSTIWPTWAYKF